MYRLTVDRRLSTEDGFSMLEVYFPQENQAMMKNKIKRWCRKCCSGSWGHSAGYTFTSEIDVAASTARHNFAFGGSSRYRRMVKLTFAFQNEEDRLAAVLTFNEYASPVQMWQSSLKFNLYEMVTYDEEPI